MKFHPLQSLHSQLSTTLMNAGLVFWTFQTLRIGFGETPLEGFPTGNDVYWGYLYTALTANIVCVVFSFIGAYKGRKGLLFYLLWQTCLPSSL